MKHAKTLATASLVALLAAPSALYAQSVLTGTDALDDRLDDIEEAVNDDIDRGNDDYRFGNPEFRPGLSGSASLGYSGNSGNNESQDLTFGTRLRYASGQIVQTLGAAATFSEEDTIATKEDLFAVYDANYYINDQFYAFALGRIESDGLADEAGESRTDAFIGFGPGYRILNSPQVSWRVQAGIGYSYLKDGLDNSTRETGYIASSRFFYAFNENVFMSNDTDVLKTDSALRINNDLGVNFKMTDVLSTRISYLSDYNDSRAIRTDNAVGFSLVYGF